MTLWHEIFNPQPIEPFEPSWIDFNKAWDWVFERDSGGDYLRAELCLPICRSKSLELRRAGIKPSAMVAVIGIWKRHRMKLPQRK